MNKILCSTGALLVYGGDYHLLEPLSAQLLYEGYEFMMDTPYYEELESLVCFLRSLNLYIPVVHCEKSIGEALSQTDMAVLHHAYAQFEQNCYLAKSIGAEKMVLHLWDGRTSDTAFHNNLHHYAALDQIAHNYDIDLCVENVVCTTDHPIKHFCALRQHYPKIHFVFDTKMAAFHQQLELLYEKEYEWLWKHEHICHYHLNDYAGGYMDWQHLQSLPIGKGTIDFDAFFAFMRKIAYHGTYTVEATAVKPDGNVDISMLNEQYRRIQRLVYQCEKY